MHFSVVVRVASVPRRPVRGLRAQPTLGLSALGSPGLRLPAAARRVWALTACPGGAFLARQLNLGCWPPSHPADPGWSSGTLPSRPWATVGVSAVIRRDFDTQPTLGVSAVVRRDFECPPPPRVWARTAGPGGALLAPRLVSGWR